MSSQVNLCMFGICLRLTTESSGKRESTCFADTSLHRISQDGVSQVLQTREVRVRSSCEILRNTAVKIS